MNIVSRDPYLGAQNPCLPLPKSLPSYTPSIIERGEEMAAVPQVPCKMRLVTLAALLRSRCGAPGESKKGKVFLPPTLYPLPREGVWCFH